MEEQIPGISNVTIKDVETLRGISIQTFTETFAAQNSESDMRAYISENLSIEKLSSELQDSGSKFYFIKTRDEVIGYLKLNSGQSQTEKHNTNALEIERIYVIKDYHRKGIGDLLLKKAIAIAREHRYAYIWLGVWEENTNAIAFYKKNGFVTYDKHIFKLGNDEQTDLMLKLILN